MFTHIYKNFLADVDEYRASERFWEDLWLRECPEASQRFKWSYPWVSTGSPDCLDGNPIFSAYSPLLHRGIRIIQYEPTSRKLELQAWPDFVGGSCFDPDAIPELVISCALSTAVADWATQLIRPWVNGRTISFDRRESRFISTNLGPARTPFDGILLPSAA